MVSVPTEKGKTMTDKDDAIKDIIKFMKEQESAEINGKNSFVCPLCGGEAWWVRSIYNNHLHCGCKKCGFKMME